MDQTRPQKIFMTADTIGGVWTYALELTKALQNFAIDVHLATMGKKLSKDQWHEVKQLPNLTLYESDYALEWMDDPWEEVAQAGQWLLRLEQKVKPDLIQLNNYAHGALPWNTPLLMVGHSCVLSWWQAVKKEEAPAMWSTYAARVKDGLQSADCVVGVTKSMLDYINHYYGPFSSTKVIYNGREEGLFRPAAKKPVVFSMGRLWDEAKNIQALRAIADRLSWPVYLAGEDYGQLQTDVNNLNYLGKLDVAEVSDWLSKASIYIMPARYEPFGLSVLEAALSGCALVLGNISSLKEVWGDAALYADPDDYDVLRGQIQGLIQHKAKRECMAEKAMARARKFSLDDMAQQYMATYRQLLRTGQAVE